MKLALLLLLLLLAGCAGNPSAGPDRERRAADNNVQLAFGYLRQGRLDLAREKIDKALLTSRDYPEAHSTAALIYDRLGEFETAERHYRQAVELKPDDGAVHNNYGVFLCARKRYAEADRAFQTALASPRYPTPEQALENIGVCARKSGDLSRAEEYLRKALQVDGRLPLSLHEMALITYETGRFLNARAYLQRYLELAEPSPALLWAAMNVESKLGDEEAAERYAKSLSAKFPHSDEARKLLELH